MVRPRHRIRAAESLRLTLAALLCLASAGPLGAQTAREYSIKASFISRFVEFIQWPGAKAAPPEPFIVSVLGDDPFSGDLERAFREAGPAGRKATVRRAADVGDLRGSRIVFIPRGERGRLDSVVRWAEANGALTIGDGEGFAERGVMINFYLRDRKVRFEINAQAAERCGFQISSLLLKVARIVEDR